MRKPMREIGTYEAKTHLPKLLDKVEKGERFIITRHGRPVAELVPVKRRDTGAILRAIEELKAFQQSQPLGVPVRDLIQEGRKR